CCGTGPPDRSRRQRVLVRAARRCRPPERRQVAGVDHKASVPPLRESSPPACITAAKMESMGIPFYYFENTEGGHGAGVTNAQVAKEYALTYVYLWQQLGVPNEVKAGR